MNKLRIVIASVLKPVTEPRAFHKLALSLRETNKYHLNIIGFCSKKTPNLKGVKFIGIFCHHRTHVVRFLAPIKFLFEIFRYRPLLIIVTTYELLPSALLAKVFLNFRLVYDLQENYHQNVLLNQASGQNTRRLLAFLIKGIEKSAHRFIDHYFFAEQVYPSQFPYVKSFTILENKYSGELIATKDPAPKERSTFIISGTITPIYGVEKAIQWFLKLQQEFPDSSLLIIGHTPLLSFQRKLEKWVGQHPQITINLSPHPLPYPVIWEAIRGAEVVLMPYETIDSIKFKIPSKLYESIALQKAVLISENPLWKKIVTAYPAGLTIDFSKTSEAANQYRRLLSLSLYQKKPGKEVTWKEEKIKLLQAIEGLLT